MDRIINNESVAICSVLLAMTLDVNDIARLYLYVVMASDRAIRKRLPGYASYAELVGQESAYYRALNRKFVEFQPVILNALTMLELSGMIEKTGKQQYDLTGEGNRMALDIQDQEASIFEEVKQAVICLDGFFSGKAVQVLYKDLKIVL